MLPKVLALAVLLAVCVIDARVDAHAVERKYDPGVSDTEIRIGNTMPYSGPASAWGTIGKAQAAYFDKINAEGGINGRKIKFISYDDSYSPPKTVEQVRRLIENDDVLLSARSACRPTPRSTNTSMQSGFRTSSLAAAVRSGTIRSTFHGRSDSSHPS